VKPVTHFARGPDGAVAYQVFGTGPLTVVFIPDWNTHVDVWFEEPRIARFFRRLASFSRVIVFDKRGTGASDPVPLGALPTIEQWMDDVGVVMDAAEVEQAAILSTGVGASMATVFAATKPQRTTALVLVSGAARLVRTEDYPTGLPRRLVDRVVDTYREGFGREDNFYASSYFPSLADDPAVRSWFARFQRIALTPAVAEGIWRWGFDVDVRSVLPAIQAPTLVMHRREDRFLPVGHGRYMAEHIPDAKYVELPGADHSFFAGDFDQMLDEVQAFLTGAPASPEVERVLSTVLFTDLVDSTTQAARLGDRRWRTVLDAHDEIALRQVERFRGRLIKTTGDGVLATFDGPARAIACARAITYEVRTLGAELRSGLHTGEVELRGADIGGIAVHLAARVMAQAGPGETWTSSTVKDLVVGSGIEFEERGDHALKGIPGRWQLLAVAA
jgi:pimeloyl-ACP methyl ester carboxylesterase/class 3 adenylate cyclase